MILAKGIYKTLNNRPKILSTARNNNVMVVGGSGSGKTFFFVTPNLLQLHSSYFITDPKGTLLTDYGTFLKKNGYKIKVFNTTNFKNSMHYNPFAYIHSEKDILEFVDALIMNTNGDNKSGSKDPFWENAEKLLYYAYIGYIIYECPPKDQNFNTLCRMINLSSVSEQDETFKNEIDLLFDALAEEHPNHFAVSQYAKFKLAAGKTAKSILISCGARLAPFDIVEVREITSYDEMELDSYGERKTACFMIISDTSKTFNFLSALMETQMFNSLIQRADNKHKGKLPIHVRCILDEFANVGKIPEFEKLISVIRSREISACIILQAESQLKSIYKDDAETISGNCDSYIFLGGKEKTTLKGVSEILGKETIDMQNFNKTVGRDKSTNEQNQNTGRELMTLDELNRMSREDCIVLISGVKPFKVKKYNPKKHPHWRAATSCKKFNYEVLHAPPKKLVLKKNEIFYLYES
ncbi:type IV secretory system conjugative DNA transfer family protein (plasmid) [Oscillospiraceae bacterium PP1C4]